MTPLAQLVALAAGLVAMLSILVVHAARPALRRALERMPPAAQVVSLELVIASPWLLPLVALALALTPSLLSLAWPALDHCRAHHDHHLHLCILHPPARAALTMSALLLAGVSWVVLVLGRALGREVRSHAAARAFCEAASPGEDGVWVVPTERVLCAVAGLRSRVIVSAGARERVDSATLSIALAHERAHVARRDVARQSLARLLASIHLAPTGAWLLEALSVARERACDETAARSHDRLDVADALVRWARVVDHSVPPALLGFGPAVLELRVRSLLDEPLAPIARRRVGAALCAMALLALGSVPLVHHALETLLGALTH